MKDSETVDDFMTQVMSIFNKLRQYGEFLSNKRVIHKFLWSLPKKFEAIVVSIGEFKDTSEMEIEELTGSLISHESRMLRYDDNTLENTFKTHLQFNRGWGTIRSSNRGRGCKVADQRPPPDNYE